MPPEAIAQSDAKSEPLAPDALSILKARLREGISASPLCVAILGWLCDVNTDPYVVVIRLHGSQVLMRLSDEKITEPFGPLSEFFGQITAVSTALQLTETQTEEVIGEARRRLKSS